MDLALNKQTWGKLTCTQRRDKLIELEAVCRKLPQIEIETNHYFMGDVYARQIKAPKGVNLVGEIHKTDHVNILSKGVIRVATEEGVKTLKAPCSFIAPAGTKRAGYVLEDMEWTTLHVTKQTDVDEAFKELIAPSYDELDKYLEN